MKSQLAAGTNGLPKMILQHGSGSRAEVYLHGAHVTSWVPAGDQEMLFVSKRAKFEAETAIRGGIPIVFPQFADSGPLPKHGWLRTREWKLREASSTRASVTLETEEDQRSLALWPHPYHVELSITLGVAFLELTLTVQNPAAEAFAFTSALHSYLAVSDIEDVDIAGLDGIKYVDKVRHGVVETEHSDLLRISSETDRIYLNAPPLLELRNKPGTSRLQIHSAGFTDAVVWNPWDTASRGIPDMDPDEFRKMICVEAAVVASPVELPPLESWSGTQRLTVL